MEVGAWRSITTLLLTWPLVGLDVDPQKLDAAKARIFSVMQFYEGLLGNQPYFVGEDLTLADIVAESDLNFVYF